MVELLGRTRLASVAPTAQLCAGDPGPGGLPHQRPWRHQCRRPYAASASSHTHSHLSSLIREACGWQTGWPRRAERGTPQRRCQSLTGIRDLRDGESGYRGFDIDNERILAGQLRRRCESGHREPISRGGPPRARVGDVLESKSESLPVQNPDSGPGLRSEKRSAGLPGPVLSL